VNTISTFSQNALKLMCYGPERFDNYKLHSGIITATLINCRIIDFSYLLALI